ncbi:Folate-like transporter 3 [Caenorhabditis elegans]|uniref:Folate-like transporter 3 n=1 Tax=Caenorhabditis elegans TaxID=6239 RepID=FOLT3_CAEEL|nr:Folate-like transporter 3 [Caenorhabditis elegans]Q22931.3 RecName: Full=Folate-like transporter 3 [Caenorhabditis elegans]CCD67752.1 Folate-like transporter 3 [Caenorhabditis elegans]|eukprot:NP_001041097.2 Folate-like transporter 3 [Caenorhabditis elegans]
MGQWKVMILICLYGAVKEFRPTEPYMYEYQHTVLNISEHTLNSEVYPIWTYSYLVALIPSFLLTDVLLYKPILIIEALSYFACWMIFVFGRSVWCMQLLELFYGWATATEIAYFAYIYVKVPKEDYKSATAYTRAALLVGRFLAYTLAQLLIGLNWADYMTLNIINLVSMTFAVFLAAILPHVPWRNAYQKKLEDKKSVTDLESLVSEAKYSDYLKLFFVELHQNLYTIYKNPLVLKWSIWSALSSCIFYQIINYTQTLWGTLPEKENKYNGIPEALVPLLGIPADLITRQMNVNWNRWGDALISVGSLLQAGLLFWMSQSHEIIILYICYIIYRVIYQLTTTIAQSTLALTLDSRLFGLLFGINTFVALALQSILTAIVIDAEKLAIRAQFVVYSGYHIVVATLFGIIFGIWAIRTIWRKRSH